MSVRRCEFHAGGDTRVHTYLPVDHTTRGRASYLFYSVDMHYLLPRIAEHNICERS